MSNNTTIGIQVTKRGFPAMWEKGGAGRNTGEATLIADTDGKPKKVVFVRTKGHLSNSEHALIIVKKGDLVVSACQGRGEFDIQINRITNIDLENKIAELELVNKFDQGEWDKQLDEKYKAVVDAAKRKAMDYHCRIPYWIQQISL